ncbi:MAG: AAA family ATPase [Endomicrobium sp.]|jgi:wobble nucleotide-excising tRNase|nr:AAA family ATPase [Endomicrobium sp.]
MITKINKIKDFGIFKNFKNFKNDGAVPEFKKFNLIYGWNYSGKTMLSRVFRCLEKSKMHLDYTSAKFELETPEAKYDNDFSSTKPNIHIRVFNSDFIKENLKWDAENIEPIFILGEENIKLQTELKEKEEALVKAKEGHKELQKYIDKAATDKAREITNILSLGRTFDRDALKQIIEKVKNDPSRYILETDLDRYKTQALSTEQKQTIDKITFNIEDLEKLKEKVEDKLHRQAVSNKIEELLKNPQISSWVETGKNLHEGKTVCEFCGNPLPIDLLPKLNEHFSKDYESLKNSIKTLLEELNAFKINLNSLPTENAFYTYIQPNFKKAKLILEKEICNFSDAVSSLINDLKTKQEKPFDKLEVTQFANNTKELEKALSDFNTIISENNERTDNFTKEKNDAIEKVKEHFASEFEKNEKYSETQTQLENKQINIKMQEQEIGKIKTQLNESTKGAEKVNEYLKIFFEKDDIKIEATDDKKFKLVRGTKIAKNLSEGEKTAISFAYFAAKLEEQNNNIADTIVYIDDPVSSLDSNHLFNIYSFIKNMFYEFGDSQGNKHICKCKQLFISTHNIEFYNLVCDWFGNLKKEATSYYLIKRTKNAHKDESILIKSDDLIKKYKSEYVYLFSLINEFHNKPKDTFEHLYYLPNVLRRFVETYLSFKYLSHKNINEDIRNLISNPVDCERARKFMHYYSHSLTTNNLIGFPDSAKECTNIVDIIIEAVKQNDQTHYDSLVKAVKDPQ